MSRFDLSGKVAIITGSSKGIGLAMAEAMAAGQFHQAAGAPPVVKSKGRRSRGRSRPRRWRPGRARRRRRPH